MLLVTTPLTAPALIARVKLIIQLQDHAYVIAV